MRGKKCSYEISTNYVYSKHKLSFTKCKQNINNSWNIKTDSEINAPYDTENVIQLNLIEF